LAKRTPPGGNDSKALPFICPKTDGEFAMMKGGLLWLIGIPLPIILGLWLFGFLS
jgi:hypothetical protein